MNVLVFSPHPDDAEVLMGGTIAKYTSAGHNVLIVLVTLPNRREQRLAEARTAAAILGAQVRVLDVPPRDMTFGRSLVGRFDGIVEEYLPHVIYTCWTHDSHQDHSVVSKASIAAARKNTCSLYMYEQALPGGLVAADFSARAFVDISETIETKIRSVLAHESQVEQFTARWVDGIRGRARYMGYRVSVDYAEAFEVVKELVVIPDLNSAVVGRIPIDV